MQLAFSSKNIPDELRKKTDWFVEFCDKGNTDPEWQWRVPFTTNKYSFDEVTKENVYNALDLCWNEVLLFEDSVKKALSNPKASTITLLKKSITKLDTEIIVNAANSQLQHGSGVCGYIFDAAGASQLQKACNEIGGCPTGSAVITSGFSLCKYIVHAVGPIYRDGNHHEPQDLYSCYRKSLDLAKENDCHSIGFPLISAGIFGYPKDKAWRKALQAVNDWINENPNYTINVEFAILDDSILDIGISTAAELNIDISH